MSLQCTSVNKLRFSHHPRPFHVPCIKYSLKDSLYQPLFTIFTVSFSSPKYTGIKSSTKSATMVFSLWAFNYINATLACNIIPIPIVSIQISRNDSNLPGVDHINDLILQMGLAVNFLKLLSSSHYGDDPVILASFYKTFIRFKLDYGFILSIWLS